MTEDQIREIVRETVENILEKQESRRIYQSDIIPFAVKSRHIDGIIIKKGVAADRPTDGDAVGVWSWWSTDTFVLSIWTGSAWKTVTLS